MHSNSGLGGTTGGMLATTQPAPPAKRGETGASSIAEVATDLGSSGHNRTTTRDCCDTCGATSDIMHYTAASLLCSSCAREIRRTLESRPMVPTPEGRRQLELWIRGAP
jgi:hypothetical protein